MIDFEIFHVVFDFIEEWFGHSEKIRLLGFCVNWFLDTGTSAFSVFAVDAVVCWVYTNCGFSVYEFEWIKHQKSLSSAWEIVFAIEYF